MDDDLSQLFQFLLGQAAAEDNSIAAGLRNILNNKPPQMLQDELTVLLVESQVGGSIFRIASSPR